MRKKELKNRVFQLEAERDGAIVEADAWKHAFYGLIENLAREHFVKSKITFRNKQDIRVVIDENSELRYVMETTKVLPIVSLDFTQHDNVIRSEYNANKRNERN